MFFVAEMLHAVLSLARFSTHTIEKKKKESWLIAVLEHQKMANFLILFYN